MVERPTTAGQEPARASPLALPAGVLLAGQYRIGQVLGQPHGFGITYLAWDEKLETRVAIKEFFPRELAGRGSDGASVEPGTGDDELLFEHGLQQFLNEARTRARFDHPSIVRVRGLFQANGTGYLVMDYEDGESLSTYLARQPGERIEAARAVRILRPVLAAMEALHAEGALHGDVHPGNIYLGEAGRTRLGFGAGPIGAGDSHDPSSVLLNPGYSPPEQYVASRECRASTDVYACAATLYRMVTGREPVDAASRLTGEPLPAARELEPAISQQLDDALARALALEPRDRVQTAAELDRLLAFASIQPD